MDITSISTAFTAIKAAKDLVTTLVELRDFNQVTSTVTELNRKLIEAQEGIFSAQAKMLELQTEHFEVLEKLRKLEKGAAQAARYELIKLDGGAFAYRLKVADQRQEDIAAHGDEPIHYVCQPCLDNNGVRGVMKTSFDGRFPSLQCPICSQHFRTGDAIPYPSINYDR